MSDRDRSLVDSAFQAGYNAAEEISSDLLLQRLSDAWEAGYTACAHQHMTQRNNPEHPITRTNPYVVRPEAG
jgi:hypothetical protein